MSERLNILSVTPGQQYLARQTPSTRFTGSGEFRAENEPYGVMMTFVASGKDLPHPDEEKERRRSIELRSTNPPAETEAAEEDDSSKPKVLMTVKDATGNVIRSYRYPVHQGVNRIVWPMVSDGIRPMPGPDAPDIEDGLPEGPEVPAGEYEIALALETGDEATAAESSATGTVLRDPRSTVSATQQRKVYAARLALQDMMATAVLSVEGIVNAMSDVDTVIKLIEKQPGANEDENLEALKAQASEVKKGLDVLEKRFRTPPETKGITYGEDKIANMIGTAQYFLSGSEQVLSPTAEVYAERARVALEAGVAELDRFMTTELAAFSAAVEAAGIGLFQSVISP
jgi:hypothetical protein